MRSAVLAALAASLLVLACSVARPAPARAQTHRLVVEAPAEDRDAWRARAEAALSRRGVTLGPTSPSEPGGIDPARLAVLERAESHLRAARQAQALMEEGRALRELLRAEAALRRDLALPGAHAWLAEIYLNLGVVAAQAGDTALAEQMFSFASTLDPERALSAAEAPPATLELSRRAARRLRQSAPARFTVETRPAGAEVFLDGSSLGRAPLDVDVPPGRHLLRVTLAGQHAYAALLDTFAGERDPVVVQLSPRRSPLPAPPEPRPGEDSGEFAGRVRAYAALDASLRLWWLRATSDTSRRAVLWRCAGNACDPAAVLTAPPAEPPYHPDHPAEPPPAGHRLRRVTPWIALAVSVVAAGAVAAALARRRDVSREQQVVVLDPGDLAPSPLNRSGREGFSP